MAMRLQEPMARVTGICVLTIAMHFAPPCEARCSSGTDTTVVEEGKFLLHKFEQQIGEETFRTVRVADTLQTGIQFMFTDRGARVPLAATFRCSPDLTPLTYAIKGRPARSMWIDDSVGVAQKTSRVRDRERWSETATPGRFFTITGYAPVTMQMLMVRYWSGHGSPAELPTLPGGTVRIEPRDLTR